MILTTGTTGSARGARHDWSRLVSAAQHTDAQPGTRWLLGYNLNQFAGVQMLLHVVASRATLVVGRTNRPRDAIDAIREHRVTHVSATPTFWRLLVGMVNPAGAAELPLTQITLGGEPVNQRLLDDLVRRFPGAHISQIYGATEFGLGVSVRDGRVGLPLSLLDRGDNAPVRLRVVDGELQVRSTVGMLGYHGEAEVATEWRSTGDLVEVRDDRIHFVGRRSEVVNVGGVKVHPRPVEEAIDVIEGVDLVRAYGRPSPLTGSILAVDVVPLPGADTAALETAIREACAHMVPAARPRRIRFVDELPVEGHKVRRGSAS
jgi:acyl-coenzyme A synthetase/AMP-(fatty) acid ligase